MKEQDEDERARRRLISKTKMKEQDEDEGTRWRNKANMKEQDEDEDNVLELHPLGSFL